jgi:hypothetical protein
VFRWSLLVKFCEMIALDIYRAPKTGDDEPGGDTGPLRLAGDPTRGI